MNHVTFIGPFTDGLRDGEQLTYTIDERVKNQDTDTFEGMMGLIKRLQ